MDPDSIVTILIIFSEIANNIKPPIIKAKGVDAIKKATINNNLSLILSLCILLTP